MSRDIESWYTDFQCVKHAARLKKTQNKTLNRIEKMWIRDEAGYFFGPIFIHPEETEHEPTKMFYKKEVFLSNLEETCPMTCIIGKLLILP